MKTSKNLYLLLFILTTMAVIILPSCNGNGKSSDITDSTKVADNRDISKENNDNSSTESKYKRYGIESGYIKMETSGSYSNGSEEIYFTDWGMKEFKTTINIVKVGNIKQETLSYSILLDDWTYGWDPNTKKGTKMKMNMLDDISKNQNNDDLGEIGEDLIKKMGGVKIGTEDVLGYKCDVWEVKNLGTKTWVYKYMTFKTEVNMMGMKVVSTLVKFDENPSIPSNKFDIPTDVTFTEIANTSIKK